MSCTYRHAATRIASMAGIPHDLMLTAMDVARRYRGTFPALPPDRLRTITQLLGIPPTCGNPQQVLTRIQSALLALGILHPTHPWVERWLAMAAALGIPDDRLPIPVHPAIVATVRAQWAAPPPAPAPDRATAGIAALWQGDPIPTELIKDALRMGDRQAIVTWMAYGVWDDRFEAMCRNLTDAEIGTIVRAGVVPDAVVERIVQRWQSNDLPWDVFPLAMWDRVPDLEIARKGRARTAAMKLIRDRTLRDHQLMAAAAENPWYAKEVLVTRRDLRDHRLIDAVAKSPSTARDVLITRRDLRTDDRLIAAIAHHHYWAAEVLQGTNIRDDRLIAVVATEPRNAKDVLLACHDLSDPRLITAVAKDLHYATRILIARPDLSDDRLIETVAHDGTTAAAVLTARPDLCDNRLITAVAENPWYTHEVLITRPDLRTDPRLLTAIIRDRALVDSVLAQAPDLCDHPLLTAVRTPDGSSA